ncbi:NfeD family protein [Natronolimnobius sp. AArcel1]|uniref:NfeD family protein n=1 Tax=Natronolimnobius sp. AArcel1 TaxID=1679093 RepID=UPI0013ECE324|nr:NfeD family protein [Natronolimnobius sp. AArcel1]NGM69715.1 NfeD family protein [Natronolimnobius sp. AArcel1]
MLEALMGNMPLLLLSVGLVLMALEALSPGAHLIVIGVALVGAGLIGVLFPPAANFLVLAALTLGIGLAAAYIYNEFDFYGGKGTAQTSDSGSLAGTTGYATETITNRSGEVKLNEGGFAPYYSARTTSGTIEEGEEIIVLDPGGGNVLTVESLGAIGEDEIDRALAEEAARSADQATSDTQSQRERETERSS